MKVDISFKEDKPGVLSKEKFAVVQIKFHLTEEETHILQDNKLQDFLIIETELDPRFPKEPEGRHHLRGSRLLHGDFSYGFYNKIEAVLFSRRIEPALRNLKEYMEHHDEFGNGFSVEV